MLAPAMEPAPRQSFQPAGAGALLLAAAAASTGVGTLIGWAAGSVSLGAIGGLIVGIPLGVFVVYRRYRGYFT
jgi:F0F1-type ATP synthase assembly protein I